MAKFQATKKYSVVLLVLVVYNYSLLTHGRHIKPRSSLTTGNVVPMNNPHLPSSLSEKNVPTMPNYQVASFEDSRAAHTNAFRPTTPGSSPGVGHRKFIEDSNVKKAMVVVQSSDVKLSVSEGSKNGFKPTNPGHSPGVGHRKFKGEDNNMKAMMGVQSPDVKLSVSEGSKNGFKPTNPGHSPGVGHAQQNKIGQLN